MGKHRLRTLKDYLGYIEKLPPEAKRPDSPEFESGIQINCNSATRYTFVERNGKNVELAPIPTSERATVSVPLWQHLDDRIVS